MKELSLHLLDLIENSVGAGASWVSLEIEEDPAGDRLGLSVADDGRGMSEDMVKQATDPFFTTRTTRKVGLGLALLSAAAEQAGGKMTVQSGPGEGTRIVVEFLLSSIDRAPLGRLEDTLATAAALHPELDLQFRHRGPRGDYSLRTLDLTAELPPAQVRRDLARRVREGRRRIGSAA